MSLSTRLAHDFDGGVRQRGRGYYLEGRVRILRSSRSEVEARVRGSRNYEVSLDFAREDGVLVAR